MINEIKLNVLVYLEKRCQKCITEDQKKILKKLRKDAQKLMDKNLPHWQKQINGV